MNRRVALVTGGTRGIGYGVARALVNGGRLYASTWCAYAGAYRGGCSIRIRGNWMERQPLRRGVGSASL